MILFRKRDLIYIAILIAIFVGLFILDWYWTQNNYYPSAEKINKLTSEAEQGDAEAFKLLTRHYRVIEQNISKKIDFFHKHQNKESIFKNELLRYCEFAEKDCEIDPTIKYKAGFLLDCKLIEKQCEEFN
ncbi:MAG: hypothetical protein LBL65_08030 [Campylobacteraceae bacterium]|jgi:hypothetical protein|nr:hypothetical protein [Campylobacteraceae bacterium]